jgi:caffeoyl-CoA O-methyltransferase
LILPRLSDRGLIIVDNVLWSGAIVDPSVQDESTVALREFNDGVAARDDIHAVMLPIGDGVTLIRRR